MHEAVDILEAAIPRTDPAEIYSVTHKALASAIEVIARADDSSGIIGDACRRLLALHPKAAAAAGVPSGRLINWMMKFQFDGDVDFFDLDPVAYAPALGEAGMKTYRKRLSEVEAGLGPRPAERDHWTSAHSHDWFTLDRNAQRLAVWDHDIDAIIRTHAKDRKVAAWLHKTAGPAWPDYRDEAMDTLAASPRDAVMFALSTLNEPALAWNLAHSLALDDDRIWGELVKVYEKVDPLATLPVHQRLAEDELIEAGARHYRIAARRLAKMRKLAAGSQRAGGC